MKTTVHYYSFPVTAEGRRKRNALYARLTKLGYNKGPGISDDATATPENRSEEVEVNTERQSPGRWLFIRRSPLWDWEESLFSNFSGYYIDVTPEMHKLRQTMRICPYCYSVSKSKVKKLIYCMKCVKGTNEIRDLKLTRMQYISEFTSSPPALTKQEKDYLFPLHHAAQKKRRESELRGALAQLHNEAVTNKETTAKCRKALRELLKRS